MHIIKRKIEWTWADTKEKNSVISEDIRETEELVLDVESYVGPGKILLYEWNRILVDLDHHKELLHNYEFEAEVVVVLSLIAAYSFEK